MVYYENMNWIIKIPTRVGKQIKKLPKSAQSAVYLLIRDLEVNGPTTGGGWKNYGKLKGLPGDKRHCHLSKGRPTYVCCWEVIHLELRIVEIYYVGTHEKAPY